MTVTIEERAELISLRRNEAVGKAQAVYGLPDGRHLVIMNDDCPESPREYMESRLCVYPNRDFSGDGHMTHEEVDEAAREAREEGLATYPVKAYVHSGVALTVTEVDSYPFTDGWDSGYCGWWIAGPEMMKLAGDDTARLLRWAEGEIQAYAAYINGQVYGFIKYDAEWKELSNCWGFIDANDDYALKDICHYIGVEPESLREEK